MHQTIGLTGYIGPPKTNPNPYPNPNPVR